MPSFTDSGKSSKVARLGSGKIIFGLILTTFSGNEVFSLITPTVTLGLNVNSPVIASPRALGLNFSCQDNKKPLPCDTALAHLLAFALSGTCKNEPTLIKKLRRFLNNS